jgi:hypothetical protein
MFTKVSLKVKSVDAWLIDGKQPCANSGAKFVYRGYSETNIWVISLNQEVIEEAD